MTSPDGAAEQSATTNGASHRGPRSWMKRDTGNTGEPRRCDEQDGIGYRGKLNRARLHTPHRLTVGHVQGLILGQPPTEHVALPTELFDLPFEHGNPVFGAPPQAGQLMDVCVCAALRERRSKRASDELSQAAELLELDARERLCSVEQGQKQDSLDVIEMHAWEHATDRSALHRVHRPPNRGLANDLGAKAREVENSVLIV